MRGLRSAIVLLLALALAGPAAADTVRVKDLGRFLGWRENVLVGYGVVTGLAGSGDSPRNEVTQQALRNVLSRFGANVTTDQVRSRNVAAVMVMAVLPPAANLGDRIDVTVSSVGDARSLVGGTLLLTPLLGPDQQRYGLAQGAVVVGGYRFDANQNAMQKNHPTSAVVPGGALIEASAEASVLAGARELTFVLKDPDFTTAERIADGINASLGAGVAAVRDANAVRIDAAAVGGDVYRLVTRIENVAITPDALARVVVNERSGTVVAGGGVQISSVVISQGDIKVAVEVRNDAAQSAYYGGYGLEAPGLVVSNTRLRVQEPRRDAVVHFPNTTVADLVEGLSRVNVNTREMISILQAIKAAGALHADIVVQ
ncbi:MAG TPA: flagellar basal body P-ring protein FlgI [Phenylobacterium sp.]